MARPPVGQAMSIVVTQEQRDWLDSLARDGETRSSLIRRLIKRAMLEAGATHPPPVPDEPNFLKIRAERTGGDDQSKPVGHA